MCRRIAALALVALAVLAALAPVGLARAADAAVIVMYHRFGEGAYPATNTRLDQLDAQIAELARGGFTVRPVADIVAALKAGAALPDRTVGITIDDAYASVYADAWPRLRAAGLPFTVFVSTDEIDQGAGGMMTWDQIRELAAAGVTIGHHGAAHAHMAYADAAANAADMARATRRFHEELGAVPTLFAYPYGEYDLALRSAIAAAGFSAAFGQHSGVAHARSDMFALPRFALNERYGGLDRFVLVAQALPLPVADVTPSEPVLADNPPSFGFTVTDDLGDLGRLNCYASGARATTVERLGARRIEVRIGEPFAPGRARINCTLPGPDGRWRWFGAQFLVPVN
jgi:peptidoglycan/xylan/chitin deacetylase (PgdA/CDA1 family)